MNLFKNKKEKKNESDEDSAKIMQILQMQTQIIEQLSGNILMLQDRLQKTENICSLLLSRILDKNRPVEEQVQEMVKELHEKFPYWIDAPETDIAEEIWNKKTD